MQAANNYSKVLDLYQYGLDVKINTKFKIEHNKFAVFDEKYVVNGSYNWTNSASLKNSENCQLTIENEEIVEKYQSRFEYLWKINDKQKSNNWFQQKAKN